MYFQHDYSRVFSDTGLGPDVMPLDFTERQELELLNN